MQQIQTSRRMQGMSGNVIREILKLTQGGEVISFAGGLPSPDSFPVQTIRAITDDLLTAEGTGILQYATTEGMPALREAIAQWIPDRGINARADDVVILSGSQQGLDLFCKAFINEGDAVIVETPSYLAFLDMLHLFGAHAIHVPRDNDGMNPELLERAIKEHKPRAIYLVPTFANPTGHCMPAARRREIVEIARRYGIIIIEDDAYGCLRYSGEPVPAVKAEDYEGILYLGSFSKIVAPGLRLGYAVGHPKMLRPLVVAKQMADIHSSNLSQAIIAEFLRRDLLQPHIHNISAAYGKKRDTMLTAMDEHFPAEATFTRPEGGLFVWATLPAGVSTSALLNEAVADGVAFIPGTPFFARNHGGGDDSMRLNFSNATDEGLKTGIRRLGQVIKRHLNV